MKTINAQNQFKKAAAAGDYTGRTITFRLQSEIAQTVYYNGAAMDMNFLNLNSFKVESASTIMIAGVTDNGQRVEFPVDMIVEVAE